MRCVLLLAILLWAFVSRTSSKGFSNSVLVSIMFAYNNQELCRAEDTLRPPSQAGVMEIAPGLLGHALINVRQAILLRLCRKFWLYPLSKPDCLNYNQIHTTNLMLGQFY